MLLLAHLPLHHQIYVLDKQAQPPSTSDPQPRSTSSTVAPRDLKTSSEARVYPSPPLDQLQNNQGLVSKLSSNLLLAYNHMVIQALGRRDAISFGLGPHMTFCSRIQSFTDLASGPVWQ